MSAQMLINGPLSLSDSYLQYILVEFGITRTNLAKMKGRTRVLDYVLVLYAILRLDRQRPSFIHLTILSKFDQISQLDPRLVFDHHNLTLSLRQGTIVPQSRCSSEIDVLTRDRSSRSTRAGS